LDTGPYWEEAPCGTIPALYALLLARSPVDETSSFAAVAEGVMRASYALLSTPELMKPAVIGLDANIADVDLIEEAMTMAGGP